MGNYAPIYGPGDEISLTAGAAITGGQLLAVTGVNTVSPAGAGSHSWVGVAAFDADSGALVTLRCEGVQELTAAAAVTAGDVLIPAANGQVTPIGAGTDYSAVVGVALTSASSGAKVEVLFR